MNSSNQDRSHLQGLALLDAVINNLNDSIYAKDFEGRYITINQTGAQYLGYSVNDILGRTDYELVGSEARYWMEQDREVMTTGDPLEYENSMVIDGEARFFYTRKRPLIGPSGSIDGVIGISQEITRLRDAESRYRCIFEYAPVALWEEDFSGVGSIMKVLREAGVTDLTAHLDQDPAMLKRMVATIKVLDVNREALRLSGLRSKPQHMSDLKQVLTAESDKLFKAEFDTIYRGEAVYQSENSVVTPNGKLDVLFQLHLLPGHEADLSRVLISVVDVSPLKNTARELEQLRALYRSVVDAQSELICRFGNDHKIKLANNAFKAFFGDEPVTFQELFSDDQQAKLEPLDCHWLHNHEPLSLILHAFDQKGNFNWTEWFIRPFTENNVQSGYQAVGKDITDRKNAEDQLAGSEARWRTVFTNAYDGILVVNNQGLVLSANASAEQMAGRKLGGVNLFDLIKEDQVTYAVTQRFGRLFGQGEHQSMEYSVHGSDGGLVHLSCVATPIATNGKIHGATIIVRDVTGIKEGERRVREALVEGQDAERKRISRELHDGLGQLFTAIKLNIQSSRSATSNQEETLNGIEGLVDRSIAEVKSISRNLTPDTLSRYGLRPAIEDAIEKLWNSTKAELDLQFVKVDRRYGAQVESSVFRIFQELLNNSLVHAKATHINIQLIDHGTTLLLMIEDDGNGYDTTMSTTGLGLNNIRNRVDLLFGTLDTASNPGKGTTTTIEIPIQS